MGANKLQPLPAGCCHVVLTVVDGQLADGSKPLTCRTSPQTLPMPPGPDTRWGTSSISLALDPGSLVPPQQLQGQASLTLAPLHSHGAADSVVTAACC
mmetsp:Transcript_74997/g.223508  ORF Transcript_74997/g.223508 Transcript_74997/m.223508 type:complete len:98 (-) Transcript_74997:1079-1372(-)